MRSRVFVMLIAVFAFLCFGCSFVVYSSSICGASFSIAFF
jgi:hypothetical protein